VSWTGLNPVKGQYLKAPVKGNSSTGAFFVVVEAVVSIAYRKAF